MSLLSPPVKPWSNLAQVVYKRTYARKDTGKLENWGDTVKRVIDGNIRIAEKMGHPVSFEEQEQLKRLMMDRKAGPAGRGLWFSGAPAHDRIGGAALNNCWFFTADDWMNFVIAQDLLMLGGGVGLSVEKDYVHHLPKIKKGVSITHRGTKDASFIVPDSREGWNELLRRCLKSWFVTGRSFDFSTVCVRGYGETINGFGGTASGPAPLIEMIEKIGNIMQSREGKKLRPIDAADILCAIGEMVVAGNVRRSAIIIIGDPWDKEYLKCKRWDLGQLPSQRGMANWSVNCSDVEDLHPLFWKSYENGEAIGIINLENIKKFGRMGELKKDTADGVNPCAEACLENGEPCNLVEIFLPNISTVEEFIHAAIIMYRYAKRVTCEKYHHAVSDEVVKRNRRVGVGITGCLMSPLFTPEVLDQVYAALVEEDKRYSAELGVPESIRLTLIKPSGTRSKTSDMEGYEGLHAAFSRYMIQRIRFAANDPLIPKLRAHGHHIEPMQRLDGTLDLGTLVVDFYMQAPDGYPVADEDWDTLKQLDVLKMAQKHWADQAVSVTVYYKKDDIPMLREWLKTNLSELKTISFMCHNDHGFKQAPKEAITREEYIRLSSKITPINVDDIGDGDGALLDGLECAGGACPVR